MGVPYTDASQKLLTTVDTLDIIREVDPRVACGHRHVGAHVRSDHTLCILGDLRTPNTHSRANVAHHTHTHGTT